MRINTLSSGCFGRAMIYLVEKIYARTERRDYTYVECKKIRRSLSETCTTYIWQRVREVHRYFYTQYDTCTSCKVRGRRRRRKKKGVLVCRNLETRLMQGRTKWKKFCSRRLRFVCVSYSKQNTVERVKGVREEKRGQGNLLYAFRGGDGGSSQRG